MYLSFYWLPLPVTAGLFLLGVGVWSSLSVWAAKGGESRRRRWFAVSCIGLALWLALTLDITLFSRNVGLYDYYLEPLRQIKTYLADGNSDIIRSIWMNILLFVPGGLLLPEVLPEKLHPWLRTLTGMAILCLLSAGIEMAQGVFALGQAETGDVLANAIGAVIGALPFGMLHLRKKND